MNENRIKQVEKEKNLFRWQVQSLKPEGNKIKNHFLPFANLTNALNVATYIAITHHKSGYALIFDRVSRKAFEIDHRGNIEFYRSY